MLGNKQMLLRRAGRPRLLVLRLRSPVHRWNWTPKSFLWNQPLLESMPTSMAPYYPRQSFRVVAKKVGARSAGGEIAVGKASAGIPAPIREFAVVFLVNIRKIVCPTGKKKPALSAATTGIVGSLSIWLVRHFGITSEVAETFASALLITVTTATKGTFCDMTAEMVKVALKKA